MASIYLIDLSGHTAKNDCCCSRCRAGAGPGVLARLFRHDRPSCDGLSADGRRRGAAWRGALVYPRRSCACLTAASAMRRPTMPPTLPTRLRSAAAMSHSAASTMSPRSARASSGSGRKCCRPRLDPGCCSNGNRSTMRGSRASIRRCFQRRRRCARTPRASRLLAASRHAGAIWRHRRRARSVSLRRRPHKLRSSVDGRAGRHVCPAIGRHRARRLDSSGVVGLAHCAARTVAEYVACATGLAAEPNRLVTLRHRLRSRMTASALCDGALFTPTLEAALREMWGRWCAGDPVRPFDIEAGGGQAASAAA